MNPFLRYLADKNSAHRHTPMITRPCGLRRAGNERQVGYRSVHANIGSICTGLLQSRYDYGASLTHWQSTISPSRSDALHILVMYGRSSGRNCLRMSVGSGSRSQDSDGAAVIILDMSASVYSWKQFIVAVAGGRNVIAGPPPVALRIASTFLIKKFKKALS